MLSEKTGIAASYRRRAGNVLLKRSLMMQM